MTKTASGKYHCGGMAIIALFDLFPDDEAAEAWLVDRRRPDNVTFAA